MEDRLGSWPGELNFLRDHCSETEIAEAVAYDMKGMSTRTIIQRCAELVVKRTKAFEGLRLCRERYWKD